MSMKTFEEPRRIIHTPKRSCFFISRIIAGTWLSRVLAKVGNLFFECPGYDMVHGISTGVGPVPRWGYNGNADAPHVHAVGAGPI
jgi:hypothetical protein